MGRGIVSGLIWGLVVSIVVLAGVSLNTPLPDRAAPEQSAQPASQTEAVSPATDQTEPAAPQIPAPVAMPAPEIPDLPDQAPADAAQADETDTTATPDQTAEIAPETPPDGQAQEAAPTPDALSEAAPTPADAPILAAPPADSVASPPVQPTALSLGEAPMAPLADIPADRTAPLAAPGPLMAQDRDDSPDALDTAAPVPPASQEAPEPRVAPVTAAAPVALPNPAPAPVLPQVAPSMAALPDPMTQPTVADTLPVAAPDPAESGAATQTLAPADAPPQGALDRNAVAFTADPDRPLMSIILVDDPDGPLTPEVLAQISFPVSFAIDPLRPDAAARAAFLREAGFEVLILAAAAIPTGAGPTDVEVSLAAAQQTMPQAVAMLDSPESRIQADRPVLEATIAVLVDSGHGLVAFPRNLNAAASTARRDGVPAATAFRLLDDEDQRAPVITRYLDRAAFAAGQERAVIVVGRSRPDTITAVFSWALGGRGEGVSLAPVSAVLRRLSE